MSDDANETTESTSTNTETVENLPTDSNESKPEPVQQMDSNDDFVKEDRSFFHVTTRYKIIFLFSIVLLLIEGVLIYAAMEGALQVPMWQVAVWTLAAACSIYSIVRKSLLGLMLNIVLFFGISLLPVYSELGERFQPVIDLFTK